MAERDIERDIILVGGGESSKTIISSLMNSLNHRVRGVLFIDHDKDTIKELYNALAQYSGRGVEIRDVRLHKRVLDKEKFHQIADDMGILGEEVTWEDPLPNHPPMVRVQTALWGREILDALWDMLPTVGADDTHTGRLDEPRCMIVFLFGMTGMTSSTVGVEAATVLRKRIRSRLLNDRESEQIVEINSTLDTGRMPLFVGVGCFPPDPTDGAGQYNVAHGLHMANVIKERLAPSSGSREKDMENKPFNKFLLLDGSGAWRTQDNQADYSEWVARTLTALLTCKSVDSGPDDDTFFDSIELLDSCEPFSHVGLVMAGLRQKDQRLFDTLREIPGHVSQAFPDTQRDPNQGVLRELITSTVGTDAEVITKDVRDSANNWANSKNAIRWFNFWRPSKWRNLNTARALLRHSLSEVEQKFDEFVDSKDEEWEKWSHQRVWAMPMPAGLWLEDPLVDALPLRERRSGDIDHTTIQERNTSRQETHDMVRMLMRHLIDPITTRPVKVSKGLMMLVGSTNVKRDYPLPDTDEMHITFGGDWSVLMSEHGSLDGHPMHLLLWWQPADGKILPLHYRAKDSLDDLYNLPPEYKGWPSDSA